MCQYILTDWWWHLFKVNRTKFVDNADINVYNWLAKIYVLWPRTLFGHSAECSYRNSKHKYMNLHAADMIVEYFPFSPFLSKRAGRPHPSPCFLQQWNIMCVLLGNKATGSRVGWPELQDKQTALIRTWKNNGRQQPNTHTHIHTYRWRFENSKIRNKYTKKRENRNVCVFVVVIFFMWENRLHKKCWPHSDASGSAATDFESSDSPPDWR